MRLRYMRTTEKLFASEKVGHYLRGILCNGTTDCENSPECPEGTDGCVVFDICSLIGSREAAAVKSERERLRKYRENHGRNNQ